MGSVTAGDILRNRISTAPVVSLYSSEGSLYEEFLPILKVTGFRVAIPKISKPVSFFGSEPLEPLIRLLSYNNTSPSDTVTLCLNL